MKESLVKMKTTDAHPEHERTIIPLKHTSLSILYIHSSSAGECYFRAFSVCPSHSHSYTPGFCPAASPQQLEVEYLEGRSTGVLKREREERTALAKPDVPTDLHLSPFTESFFRPPLFFLSKLITAVLK